MKIQIITLILGILIFLPTKTKAQLLEVKQTVYGMDCSPCAHGLEKRIKKMDGVQSASVSLNNGLLSAVLNKENKLTLEELRNAIENSGFKAQSADIVVQGSLTKGEGKSFILKVSSGEEFLLIADDQINWDNYSDTDQLVKLFGKAQISNETGIKLIVKKIHKL
ncbi:MAG: heavy metal-associated domain-containing protein [Balneola sp.]